MQIHTRSHLARHTAVLCLVVLVTMSVPVLLARTEVLKQQSTVVHIEMEQNDNKDTSHRGHVSVKASEIRLPALEKSSLCNDLLQLSKVALLFLTPGKLPHERLYHEWMDEVQGLLPTSAVVDHAMGRMWLRRDKLAEIRAKCTPKQEPRRSVVDNQYLFSVYVHTHPDFKGYRSTSMFHRRIIPHRVIAKRGYHSLTVAERLLLEYALQDPHNQRFILLSETTLPLYPAAVLYQQAMSESVSRVDACKFKTQQVGNLDRWNDNMETANFKKHHWRKTSQWFSLTREHAQLVVDDSEINNAFEEYCFPRIDRTLRRAVSCSSNEHYVAIVLAVHNRSQETTCNGLGNTYVDWSRMTGDGRPRSFTRREITDLLVEISRAGKHCTTRETQLAVTTGVKQFVSVHQLPVKSFFPWIRMSEFSPVNVNCSTFIRKFPASTARVAREVFTKHLKLSSS